MKNLTLKKILILTLGLMSMLALKGPTKPIDGPSVARIDGPSKGSKSAFGDILSIDGPSKRRASGDGDIA